MSAHKVLARTVWLGAGLVAAAGFAAPASAAEADACAPVKKAATQTQAYRLSIKGDPRMVHMPDANYVRAAAGWQRVPITSPSPPPSAPRSAPLTPGAAPGPSYTDCKVVAHEKLGDAATTTYQYTIHHPGMPDRQDKMWIGSKDGLVYRLAPGAGDVEDFDYKNVQPPQA